LFNAHDSEYEARKLIDTGVKAITFDYAEHGWTTFLAGQGSVTLHLLMSGTDELLQMGSYHQEHYREHPSM
jgi:hypothetical protein